MHNICTSTPIACCPHCPFAALGEAAADALASGPGYPSMGHLVHMPSHTYLRLGRWHDAVTSNVAALEADEASVRR